MIRNAKSFGRMLSWEKTFKHGNWKTGSHEEWSEEKIECNLFPQKAFHEKQPLDSAPFFTFKSDHNISCVSYLKLGNIRIYRP